MDTASAQPTMDLGTGAGQALELLPVPFLALAAVHHRDRRDDLCVAWANPPAVTRFGPGLVGTQLDRDQPFGPMASIVAEAAMARSSSRLGVVERTIERGGRTEHLRFTVVPVEDGAAVMIEDVTAEVEVRAELAVAGRTLARVERWGNLGVWEVDLASGETYWSTQVYEILGVDEAGLDQFRAVVHPDDAPLVEHVTRRILDQPGPYQVTHRIVRGNEIRTLDQHMQSVADADGTPVRLLGTMIDITATRALQEQVHRAQQMGTVGLLAGGLAHDFNNVLLVIRGHADLLLGQLADSDPVRESLAAISQAGERASALTRRLMSLGRQDDLLPVRVEPLELLAETLELVGPALDPEVELDLDLTSSAATGGVDLLADPEQLRQVVIDLVLNARDAGARRISLRYLGTHLDHDDPRCSETGLPPGHYGVIEVADDGHGMDEGTKQRVFEPFFTTKGAGSGSGLGLANAQSFARRSLGALTVTSEPGAGCTMSLLLPASTRADEVATPARRRRRATRVLVATGHDDRRHRLSAAVETRTRQVVGVGDLDSMAFSLETEPIDAVVLDDALLPGSTLPAVLDDVATIVVTDRPGPARRNVAEVAIDDVDGLCAVIAELLPDR